MAAAGGRWRGGLFLAKEDVNIKSSKDLKNRRKESGIKLTKKLAAERKSRQKVEIAQAAVDKAKVSHRGRRAASEGLRNAQAGLDKATRSVLREHNRLAVLNDTYHADKANAKAAKAGKAKRRNTRLNVLNTKRRKRNDEE